MNNIIKNSLKGAIMVTVAALGLSACTDDHFDVQGGIGSTGTQSMWQVIQSSGEFTDLQNILSRTYMMRSETDKIDPATTKTLGELLGESQSFTMWAPADGTYDAEKYKKILDEAKAEYDAKGVTSKFRSLQYQVASQFVYNHVARFNYEGVMNDQVVTMLNGKKVHYNAGEHLFNDLPITGTYVTTNGTMHKLGGESEFAYNIYDILRYHENLDSLRDILLDSLIDTYTFIEGYPSVQGALNANGEMVYVDSVYRHSNKILDYCGAYLENEDSTYIAVLPSDKAWEDAIERLKPYFNYKNTTTGKRYDGKTKGNEDKYYFYDWDSSGDDGKFSHGDVKTAFSMEDDSLCIYNIKNYLIRGGFFSPKRNSFSADLKRDQMHEVAENADSLYSTNGLLYYNPNKGGYNPMFNKQQPENASNGIVYLVDDYNVLPEYTWMSRHEIDGWTSIAQPKTGTSHCTVKDGTTITLNEENRSNLVNDDVYKVTRFQRFSRAETGRSAFTVDYRLDGLLSGAYTIKAILTPSHIVEQYASDADEVCTLYAQVIDDHGKVYPISLGANEKYPDRSANVVVDQNEVKKYTLIEKVDIPYCFYNLPSGINSFCRLRLTVPFDPKGSAKGLNVVMIIVEPYRENGAK